MTQYSRTADCRRTSAQPSSVSLYVKMKTPIRNPSILTRQLTGSCKVTTAIIPDVNLWFQT
eukprot:5571916-Amphidinium_carterae.1